MRTSYSNALPVITDQVNSGLMHAVQSLKVAYSVRNNRHFCGSDCRQITCSWYVSVNAGRTVHCRSWSKLIM